mgnify:CR=1 FL=1
MTKEEYIRKCGGRTSKDLSADQILSYFIEGNGGLQNKMSAMTIKTGRLFGCDVDRSKGIAMLRQAFDLDKVLEVNFVDGEGVSEEGKSLPTSHFTMKFRKS